MRRGRGVIGSAGLLGSVAVLLLAFGVYVSVKAVSGLPFVPRYRIDVELPNGGQIVKNADVTLAGRRVGQVTSVGVRPRPGRPPVAVLHLALERRYRDVPVDSTVRVRIAGTLGRKFVELTPGRSSRMLPEGGRLALSQARPPSVEVDQLLAVFEPDVRQGARDTIGGLGVGFAGRGRGLNDALGDLPPMLGHLESVAGALAAPRTRLDRFVRGLTGVLHELAPVAPALSRAVDGFDRTFAALDAEALSLRATLTESPPTLATGIEDLPTIEPLLRQTAGLLGDLRPGLAHLPAAAPQLEAALAAGVRALPRVPTLTPRLVTALGDVADFAEDPRVRPSITRVGETARALTPLVDYLAPAQTTCNYLALAIRNASSLFKEGVTTGTTVRAGGVVVGVDRNSERGPSDAPYAGRPKKALGPLNTNPHPNTAAPGQPRECEAGREVYDPNGPQIGTVPGNQGATTESADLP